MLFSNNQLFLILIKIELYKLILSCTESGSLCVEIMYYIYNSTNFNTIIHKTTLKSKIKIPYEKNYTFFTKYMKYLNKIFTKSEKDDENDVIIIKINPGWKQY